MVGVGGGKSKQKKKSKHESSRNPLSLSLTDRMFLALGCAKGLAALHAYNPALCHRDIKSFNFLGRHSI